MSAFQTVVKFFQDCGLFIYPSLLIMALGLSIAILVLTLVKNLTDAGSTLASYVGVGLAGLIVLGCVLDRRQTQAEDRAHVVGARRP